MNSTLYPEEVAHLALTYGEPLRLDIELKSDPVFQRSFRASLRRRRAEVAFVIQRPGGTVLTTAKAFYPAGIYRIPTGGVKPGESVEEALWREIGEETGLEVHSPVFGALIEYRLTADGTTVRFATYLFLLDGPVGEPRCTDPDEEICEFRELTPLQLKEIGQTLANLGPSWRSWGLWRSVPHEVAADLLLRLQDTREKSV